MRCSLLAAPRDRARDKEARPLNLHSIPFERGARCPTARLSAKVEERISAASSLRAADGGARGMRRTFGIHFCIYQEAGAAVRKVTAVRTPGKENERHLCQDFSLSIVVVPSERECGGHSLLKN